ncbi:MAG: class I SAM-dependent methyltransferase [Acidimicrobiales bacterium]
MSIDRDRLERLPTPSSRRLAVRVRPDALRRIRAGHPWVYDRSIESVSHGDGRAGELGVVFDRRRRFAAIGLWDPRSPIRLRILHVGQPTTIDAAWFADRVAAAVAARRELLDRHDRSGLAPYGPGFRAVNGENDGLPGLVVDCYDHVAVVKLYSGVWFPHLRAVVAGVAAATGTDAVVLRLARNLAGADTHGLADGDVVAGDLADGPVLFTEGGLTFEADVRRGQKTGHFLDQRSNRLAVGCLADGKRVLDVFASTGGFTVHAAAGGATSVHAIDASAPTLEVIARNLGHNAAVAGVASCPVTTEVGDAFDTMGDHGRAGNRYDLVIVDPPSFAQRATAVSRGRAAYAKLTKLAIGLIEEGGILVQASCSARITPDQFFATVTEAAADHGATLTELCRSGHDIDHPVTFDEGGYLKAGFWRVDPGRPRRAVGRAGGRR